MSEHIDTEQARANTTGNYHHYKYWAGQLAAHRERLDEAKQSHGAVRQASKDNFGTGNGPSRDEYDKTRMRLHQAAGEVAEHELIQEEVAAHAVTYFKENEAAIHQAALEDNQAFDAAAKEDAARSGVQVDLQPKWQAPQKQ